MRVTLTRADKTRIGRVIAIITCAALPLHAAGTSTDDLHLAISVGASNTIEVILPLSLPTNELRYVEWSTDLDAWEPVALDYGTGWGNSYPHVVDLTNRPSGMALVDDEGIQQRFYRAGARPAPNLSSNQLAARFLQQATFGPTRATISNLVHTFALNYEAWIDDQMQLPLFSHRVFFRERSDPTFISQTNNPGGDLDASVYPTEVGNVASNVQIGYRFGPADIPEDTNSAAALLRPPLDPILGANLRKRVIWHHAAITAEDQLRQRVAWALAQIFVLGEAGSSQPNVTEPWTHFYDIFVRHAFGHFSDILSDVTYHPTMGDYLTYVNNKKEEDVDADGIPDIFPDENYAREVMQLFTIGLWQLNSNGTFQVDAAGDPIPTYDNSDIEEFAKVFTGLRYEVARTNIEIRSGNLIDPMRSQESWHDITEKTLLNGNKLDANQTVRQDIDGLLKHLFQHPNVAPFIARKLIQRLTRSNPSPAYIAEVATAFASGLYQGVGSGKRGDLAATVKAIYLHPEVRIPAASLADGNGKLREPIIRLMHVARAFNIYSIQTYGLFPFHHLETELQQSPYQAPTVFNFYTPDYQPQGKVLNRELFAPEFQIVTDVTALRVPNGIRELVYNGLESPIGRRWYHQAELDMSHETSLAGNVSNLIDHLDVILTAGRLEASNRAALETALGGMPGATEGERASRVRRAIALFALLPEFNVLY